MSEHDKAHASAPTADARPAATDAKAPGLAAIDVNEYGGKKDGERQMLDRRLFMQLLVFTAEDDPARSARQLADKLLEHRVPAIVYDDANDPRGVALLTWSDDPAHFVTRVRHVLADESLRTLRLQPDFTMLGRTYATGHEPQLAWSLLERPIENVTHPAHDWAVWYPLRRTGAFSRLDGHEQAMILREHAHIGMAYGQAELAHDVRLACHGIDRHDNDFVISPLTRPAAASSRRTSKFSFTRPT